MVQVSNSGRKLHIIKAQTTNAGRYTCIVRNAAGEADVDMEVIVLVPPRIQSPGFRTMEGIVNQTVQIDCRTTGIPEPKVLTIWHCSPYEFLRLYQWSCIRLNGPKMADHCCLHQPLNLQ